MICTGASPNINQVHFQDTLTRGDQ